RAFLAGPRRAATLPAPPGVSSEEGEEEEGVEEGEEGAAPAAAAAPAPPTPPVAPPRPAPLQVGEDEELEDFTRAPSIRVARQQRGQTPVPPPVEEEEEEVPEYTFDNMEFVDEDEEEEE